MASTSDLGLPGPGRRRACLGLLVVAWGLEAIVTQSLLVREALVLMFGSEFAWGIVLFAWLLGVAGGATVGGWIAPKLPRPDAVLVIVLLALSVTTCAELWLFRGARAWLGIEPGELLPLPLTALAAVAFVSPAGAMVGAAFPLACCVTDDRVVASPRMTVRGLISFAQIYALESLGSLIGGAAFSFWAVEHLAPIQTALLCGAVTAAASAGFLATSSGKRDRTAGLEPTPKPWHRRRFGVLSQAGGLSACDAQVGPCHRRFWARLLAGLAALALLVAGWGGETLERRLVLRRWRNVAPGYELCAEAESRYQNLALGRRADQYTLYCDGQVSADFPDPYTFAPLAHFWMCQHPAPRHVLVLGGGAEGLLAEILRHPVVHVDYVEPDPRQIELIEPYLPEADRRALGDERVTIHHVDARYFVKTQRDRFDLVLARLPEPTSALRARFYTAEFCSELRRAMTDRSVLCMTAAATPADLTRAAAEYLASIRATLHRQFPYLTVGWGNPAQILAGTKPGLVSTDPTELANRYTQRGVQSELFHPLWFEGATDWLEPDKLRARAEQLDAVPSVEISTDLRPAVYIQRLALWEQMTGGRSGQVMAWLRSVRWSHLVAAVVAVAAAVLIAGRLRSGGAKGSMAEEAPRASARAAPRAPGVQTTPNPWATSIVTLSVATTGFATMALSIIWLFAFQNLYGYVYQRIGWIIAMFMGGLVVGCWLIGWRLKRAAYRGQDPANRYLWRRLIAVDTLIALLALTVPFVLPVLGNLQDTRLAFALVEWVVSIMVAGTGVLCGAAFALAGGLQLAASGQAGTAAGSVVGADHAGACAGALLTGILLVPVFGTASAALLLVGIKLGSAGLLLVGWRLSRPA